MKNEVLVNQTIMIASLVAVIMLLVVYRLSNNKQFPIVRRINKKAKRINGVIEYLGLMIAVIAIGVSSVINLFSIRKSEMDVQIVEAHRIPWEEDHPEGVLFFCIDEKGHVSNRMMSMVNEWMFRLSNKGNADAKNVTVEISMDHVAFSSNPEPDDYDLRNHLHGIGAYTTISRVYESVNPGESIVLDPFPVNNASPVMPDEEKELKKGSTLRIVVYSEEGVECEKEYKCEYGDPELIIGKSIDDGKEESVLDKIKTRGVRNTMLADDELCELDDELGELLFMDNGAFYGIDGCLDLESCRSIVKKNPQISKDVYRVMYLYFLRKMDVYNRNMRVEYRKKATVYGRMYYLTSGESRPSEIVAADIEAYMGRLDYNPMNWQISFE